MLSAAYSLLQRELRQGLRRPGDALALLGFFLIAACLYPLGVGSQPALLRALGPGVLWTTALLASLLALGRLFEPDLADGSLEQLLLSAQPLSLLLLAKVLAHWLLSGLPLLLLAPLPGLLYGLPPAAVATLAASLLLGTPVLSLLGAVVAALTLGLRGGTVLLSLLLLPLAVPVLVFGAAAVQAAATGESPLPQLQVLAGLLALALAACPVAIAAALRIGLE